MSKEQIDKSESKDDVLILVDQLTNYTIFGDEKNLIRKHKQINADEILKVIKLYEMRFFDKFIDILQFTETNFFPTFSDTKEKKSIYLIDILEIDCIVHRLNEQYTALKDDNPFDLNWAIMYGCWIIIHSWLETGLNKYNHNYNQKNKRCDMSKIDRKWLKWHINSGFEYLTEFQVSRIYCSIENIPKTAVDEEWIKKSLLLCMAYEESWDIMAVMDDIDSGMKWYHKSLGKNTHQEYIKDEMTINSIDPLALSDTFINLHTNAGCHYKVELNGNFVTPDADIVDLRRCIEYLNNVFDNIISENSLILNLKK